jgi:hypothetical protein
MNRKDRIAVVMSVMYTLFCVLVGASTNPEKSGAMLFIFISFMMPLFLYWGYRFIKNDISFLRSKEE